MGSGGHLRGSAWPGAVGSPCRGAGGRSEQVTGVPVTYPGDGSRAGTLHTDPSPPLPAGRLQVGRPGTRVPRCKATSAWLPHGPDPSGVFAAGSRTQPPALGFSAGFALSEAGADGGGAGPGCAHRLA